MGSLTSFLCDKVDWVMCLLIFMTCAQVTLSSFKFVEPFKRKRKTLRINLTIQPLINLSLSLFLHSFHALEIYEQIEKKSLLSLY